VISAIPTGTPRAAQAPEPRDARLPGGSVEPADGPVLDASMIAQLRGDFDAPMREQLVEAFRAQLATCVAQIQTAIEEGDEPECRRVAHGLKGSSVTLGAARLARLCERLESRPLGAPDCAGEIAHLRRLADESLGAVTEALA